ncbi:LLM class flavin-dependent oxidoreductase [Actinokineospora terrae]|uniref:Probable F420-dependent oxidoreductase, Rv2161c family n=1 Tax=Actinokineospora terrae TaxID=155974 RepID=A0A1H9VW50_9PSEU|nr:LLM class flavin-dependent oxidoreductase [Actinokineospora terrae]SES25986.1 probable F420-dependent oxidoreductase, Rv2161c family [Actinokineospora terrae]
MSASFGYLLPTFAQAGLDDLVELGRQAEDLGLDAVWVPDSPLVYGLPDPLVLLSALAATTERITIATGVLLGALRHPVLLAHSLATLDRLARGRLVVGLGSGFTDPATERQFAALGVPFRDRGERLAESITVLRSLWTGAPITQAGRHFTFHDVALSPLPHSASGPPIWLAGSGARAEARVGRLADGWLPYPPTVDRFVDGWRRVQAAAAGRTDPPVPGLYATIAVDSSADKAQQRLRTVVEQWYGYPFDAVSALQAMFAGTPAGVRDWLEPYLEAGVRTVVLRVADDQLRRGLETAAAVRALFT